MTENEIEEWRVMKFGGTSVGTADRLQQVSQIVEQARLQEKCRPVVVLSAMSSNRKSEGTTSRLLQAAEECLKPGSHKYLELVDAIEQHHMRAAQEAVLDLRLRVELQMELRVEFQKLRNFLEAAEIIDEISPRSRDVIVGTGEKLACRLFCSVLKSRGVPAVFVPLDRLVDERRVSESQLDQSFYDSLSVKLAKLIRHRVSSTEIDQKSNFMVPIVTGFMGYIPGGLLQAVGRGYSDFTAALASAGLKRIGEPISELQIWKEVDGIFTADPRIVPNAMLLPRIYPDEAAELTYYGSEVIHPFTMEQVIRAQVAIRIKNTFKPHQLGTIIITDGYEASTHIETPHPHSHSISNDITATAVTLKNNVCCLNIHSNRKSVSHGFLASIFSVLDKHGIVADLISTSEVHVSMALSNTFNNLYEGSNCSLPASQPLENQSVDCDTNNETEANFSLSKMDMVMRDLEHLGDVSVLQGMAIVSLVGKQMKNMVGIAGKMFSALAGENVNIEMISQGASEINISCVVLESDAPRAVREIHRVCVLDK